MSRNSDFDDAFKRDRRFWNLSELCCLQTSCADMLRASYELDAMLQCQRDYPEFDALFTRIRDLIGACLDECHSIEDKLPPKERYCEMRVPYKKK